MGIINHYHLELRWIRLYNHGDAKCRRSIVRHLDAREIRFRTKRTQMLPSFCNFALAMINGAEAEVGGLTGRRRRSQDRVNPVRGEVDETGKPDRTAVMAGIGRLRVDQETLALIRIRSEMDTTFRDATLKVPLWEEVSRPWSRRRSGRRRVAQPPSQPPHKETTREEAGTPRSAPAPTSAGLSLALVPVATEQHVVEAAGLGGGESVGGPSSSRWPKTEVHALIQLRMDMDNRYQENGPKGPLWEEISAGMRRLGYSRNSKRCKEKWENINKYFKKVKESNKRRPEDSKTCPYFHQLEAIYRKKHNGGGSSGAAANNAVVPVPAVAEHQNLNRHEIEIEGKKINDTDKRNNGGVGAAQPEDAVRELNEQPHREFTTDETDSDDMGDDYTDDGEDGEDDGKMQYRIQFQRPNPVGTNNAPPSPTTAATAAPTSTPASSFLAMGWPGGSRAGHRRREQAVPPAMEIMRVPFKLKGSSGYLVGSSPAYLWSSQSLYHCCAAHGGAHLQVGAAS
ncbi:unnamed protein product [Triticum turgidum subsp. durum]|uniref:Myb-like domain-containing protein n=1 Tax=Triticum turgidum subsp. durum TaxID=4567 RepID=A0A9R1P0T3_TRITD|nr:unnamed protein product [Triticum turgidum subsp. durum]